MRDESRGCGSQRGLSWLLLLSFCAFAFSVGRTPPVEQATRSEMRDCWLHRTLDSRLRAIPQGHDLKYGLVFPSVLALTLLCSQAACWRIPGSKAPVILRPPAVNKPDSYQNTSTNATNLNGLPNIDCNEPEQKCHHRHHYLAGHYEPFRSRFARFCPLPRKLSPAAG